MESKENLNQTFFSEYKNLVLEYVEERVDLAHISAVEKTAVLTAKLSFGTMILAFALFAIFFLNLVFALLLGAYLNNQVYGFLIVTGFYVFLIVLAMAFKGKIEKPIMNLVVKQLMSKHPLP